MASSFRRFILRKYVVFESLHTVEYNEVFLFSRDALSQGCEAGSVILVLPASGPASSFEIVDVVLDSTPLLSSKGQGPQVNSVEKELRMTPS